MNRCSYPVYKPSDVEWLGPVPEGWSISKLGFHASVKARLGWKGLKADEYVDEGFIFLSTPNIKNRHIDFDEVNYITKERYFESPEIMLEVGDVLIAKDGSTLGTTNVVRKLPAPATVNSSIAVLRPKSNLNSGFLYWIMTCPYTQSIIQQVKDGQGVPHLFQADLRKFWVWLPSYEEQPTIADYLDHETTRIDSLIEKKQRQIELLQEKRTALISHAVTKGLNPNVNMKDSGVEWLGKIPEHWEVSRLGYAFRLQAGFAFQSGSFAHDGVPIVKMSNLKEGQLDLSNATKIPENQCMPEFALESGDLVIGMSGSISNFAVVGERDIPCQLNQRVGRFLETGLKATFYPYLQYLVSSLVFMEQMELTASGTAQANISSEEIGHFYMALPSADEQRTIAVFLDRETGHIDALIEKVEKSIALLREYRTSLISAAVTGKIDVRKETIV